LLYNELSVTSLWRCVKSQSNLNYTSSKSLTGIHILGYGALRDVSLICIIFFSFFLLFCLISLWGFVNINIVFDKMMKLWSRGKTKTRLTLLVNIWSDNYFDWHESCIFLVIYVQTVNYQIPRWIKAVDLVPKLPIRFRLWEKGQNNSKWLWKYM
jgi:hypothetical protein